MIFSISTVREKIKNKKYKIIIIFLFLFIYKYKEKNIHTFTAERKNALSFDRA